MPYPAQINRDTIIQQARQMIEAHGVDHLSLGKLADELGVKAPSLYRHVGNKNALLQAVNTATINDLFASLYAALDTAPVEPVQRLQALARAFRQFAHANPRTYALAYTTSQPEQRPDPDALVAQVLPLQREMAAISGDAHSLTALRGALAIMHGFILLELNAQLQRGGDLAAAYHDVVAAYLRGWQST